MSGRKLPGPNPPRPRSRPRNRGKSEDEDENEDEDEMQKGAFPARHYWFLPTLFSDVAVKGFSNGAKQTRAPILHYGTLNQDLPVYWEGMNGERIFMWYATLRELRLTRLRTPVCFG